MVDLVKIRKKAKKSKPGEEPEAAAPAAAAPAEPPAAPGTPASGTAPAATAPAPAAPAEPEPRGSTSQPAEPAAPAARTGEAPGSTKLDQFKQQAGKRREVADVTAAEQTGLEGRFELLTFLIADEQYAVDIERIVEIVTPRPVTRIPNSDPTVVGILSLRGTIVTLLDVRRKLGHPPAGPDGPDTRIVVIDSGNETVGFIVDRVLRVVKAAAAEIEPHPVVHATELDESVRGVFRVAGALTILLDLDKLLDQNALA